MDAVQHYREAEILRNLAGQQESAKRQRALTEAATLQANLSIAASLLGATVERAVALPCVSCLHAMHPDGPCEVMTGSSCSEGCCDVDPCDCPTALAPEDAQSRIARLGAELRAAQRALAAANQARDDLRMEVSEAHAKCAREVAQARQEGRETLILARKHLTNLRKIANPTTAAQRRHVSDAGLLLTTLKGL